jgi:ribosome-binding factor A
MPHADTHKSRSGPSQRQLRVGELVRHALAEVFSRSEAGVEFDGVLVSFAEVRMSPDLKHATVLVAPLAKDDPEALVASLNKHARALRGKITPALRQMRSMPDLKFRLDTRFEDDARIDALLRSPEVARDLQHDPEKWEPVFGQDHAQTKSVRDDKDDN